MLAWGWTPVRLCALSNGKGYCVRRRALIQSLYLKGYINWLQMAHMVLIKDYLAAAGSVRVCVWVCVYVCVFGSIWSILEQTKYTCLCTQSWKEYECLYVGIKLHKICVFNQHLCTLICLHLFLSVFLLRSNLSADKWVKRNMCVYGQLLRYFGLQNVILKAMITMYCNWPHMCVSEYEN